MTKGLPGKLLDEAILPVCLIVAARYIGAFLAGLMWPIEFTFNLKFDLLSLPFIRFGKENDLLATNSFSWGVVGLSFALIFGFVLFRALIFHRDYLHPKEAKRAHSKNLDFLIIGSREAFSQGVVWGVLVVILLGLATTDFLTGALAASAYGLLVGVSVSLLLVFWQGVAKRPAA